VDGVLLVVSAGQTRRESVQVAKAKLEKVNANLAGAVLTNVPLDASLQRYYYVQEEEEE
jgi:Mrp family chromosome partitioning ATPase